MIAIPSLILIIAPLLLAGGVMLGYWLGRSSQQEGQRILRSGLERISTGDLYPIEMRSRSKLRTLAAAVANQVSARIADQVTRIRSNAALLLVDVEAMSRLQQDVAVRTESQAANIEQVAATVAGLSDGMQQTAALVEKSVNAARHVRQLTSECKELSAGAQGAMNEVNARSVEMDNILGRIDRIAKTTQVLSMNASVAAVRAGSEGRGFHAIATEIRSLASQSGEALSGIRALIARSNASTSTGVQRMNSVHLAIDRMAAGLAEITADFERHAQTAADHSTALYEMSEAVSALDRITQENAAVVDVQTTLAFSLSGRAERLAELFTVWRSPTGAADEARTLVLRAVAAIGHLGYQEGLRSITSGATPCADRDMYVFVYDESARYIAFAGKPERVGRPLPDTPGRNRMDVMREGMHLASLPAGGWMEYATPHPDTGEMLPKMSYVRIAADHLVVGCGIYKVL